MTEIVRVKTSDTAESMIASHGSASWYGTRSRFESADYLVAIDRKTRKPILIAEIDEVVAVPESGPNRYALQFSRYARLVPAKNFTFKPDGSQNPAINTDLSIILPDLNLDDLSWNAVGKKTRKWSFGNDAGSTVNKKFGGRGLTIAEAKLGLSIGLGVSENDIQITVTA